MRETAGSAAAPAARCRKFRRGRFIFEPPFTSFDHLIDEGEERRRDREAKHLGRLYFDYQLAASRLPNPGFIRPWPPGGFDRQSRRPDATDQPGWLHN